MQRRNLTQCAKNRPKLVIERPPSDLVKTDPSKLGKSISISKLITINKQNEQPQHKSYKRHSLKPIHKEVQDYSKLFKSHNSSALIHKNSFRNITNSQISDDHKQNVNHKMKIKDSSMRYVETGNTGEIVGIVRNAELFVEDMLKKPLTLGIQNSKIEDFNFNSSKIRQSIQRQQLENGQQNQDSCDSNNRNPRMSIQKCLDQAFFFQDETEVRLSNSIQAKPGVKKSQLRLQSCVLSYRLWEEALTQENSFVLQQLAECSDYITAQPNKILHEACRRHKFLEEELFAYADMLSISQVGAKIYTPQSNIQQMEDELDRAMRTLNRQLIQGQQSIEQKCRMLRDYVLQVRQAYSSILQELMKVIDSKTDKAKTFVFKVLKWQENYITRKEFLSNLKKDYFQAMFRIEKEIAYLSDVEAAKGSRITIAENIGKMNRVYMLGNSFY